MTEDLASRITDLESRTDSLEIDLQLTMGEATSLRAQRDHHMQRLHDLEDEKDRLWKSVGALEEAIQALEFPSYMDCEETNEEGSGI